MTRPSLSDKLLTEISSLQSMPCEWTDAERDRLEELKEELRQAIAWEEEDAPSYRQRAARTWP